MRARIKCACCNCQCDHWARCMCRHCYDRARLLGMLASFPCRTRGMGRQVYDAAYYRAWRARRKEQARG
jgi:hypothetical protein